VQQATCSMHLQLWDRATCHECWKTKGVLRGKTPSITPGSAPSRLSSTPIGLKRIYQSCDTWCSNID